MLCQTLGKVPICMCSQGVGVIAGLVDVLSPVLAAYVPMQNRTGTALKMSRYNLVLCNLWERGDSKIIPKGWASVVGRCGDANKMHVFVGLAGVWPEPCSLPFACCGRALGPCMGPGRCC